MEANLTNGEQKHHHMVPDLCDTGIWPNLLISLVLFVAPGVQTLELRGTTNFSQTVRHTRVKACSTNIRPDGKQVLHSSIFFLHKRTKITGPPTSTGFFYPSACPHQKKTWHEDDHLVFEMQHLRISPATSLCDLPNPLPCVQCLTFTKNKTAQSVGGQTPEFWVIKPPAFEAVLLQ